MRDPDYDPDAVRKYECFDCGKIVESSEDPGLCPACNTEMRDRHFGME